MQTIACDIDGVVADDRHRQHFLGTTVETEAFLEGGKADWASYYGALGDDPPIPLGIALVRALSWRHKIVWVTGRPNAYREETLCWLRRHLYLSGFPTIRLVDIIMRKDGDHRTSSVAKPEMYQEVHDLALVIEDNLSVIVALDNEHIPVLGFFVPEGHSILKAITSLT